MLVTENILILNRGDSKRQPSCQFDLTAHSLIPLKRKKKKKNKNPPLIEHLLESKNLVASENTPPKFIQVWGLNEL